MRFPGDLFPADGGKVVFPFIALVNGKRRVPVQHLAHGAVTVFFHALPVLGDGLQQGAVLFAVGGPAVAFETAALHQVQQNAGKLLRRDGLIQSAGAQRVDVLQMAGREKGG